MAAKRVLLVNDEPELVKAVKIRLESAGYEVLTAYDGEEGLKKAKEYKPDLIVLDVLMPKMQGDFVAEALKEDEGTCDIPIIFLTCLVEDVVQGSSVIAGNLFLAQPFNNKELLLMVDKILKK